MDTSSALGFRLVGFDGVGLFLRTCVFPVLDEHTGQPQSVIGVDIRLLTVAEDVRYLTRECSPNLAADLAAFMSATAQAWHPHAEVAPMSDEVLGLQIACISSDETDVELLIRVAVAPAQGSPVWHEQALRTSRIALLQAAVDAGDLDPSWKASMQ